MRSPAFSLVLFFLFIGFPVVAQTDSIPVFKGAIKTNRARAYSNIVKNSIIKNLGLPLTDSTEENWEDAFYAMEVLNYKQPWVFEKIKKAFDSVEKRSDGFQRALLELCYSNYPKEYEAGVLQVLNKTTNAKNFSMAAEYILQSSPNLPPESFLSALDKIPDIKKVDSSDNNVAILESLEFNASGGHGKISQKQLEALFKKKYLQSNTIVYSIQRKNRNYPGIAIVKGKDGDLIKDESGNIFSVPQLARSITNLPSYLTNGNTPQGFFRMYGFDVSKSAAIGPTENIQLTMPFETTVQHFLKDSSITDSIWTLALYEKLIPREFRNNEYPLFGTFFASKAGRTEIISHGTTIDPVYYIDQPYYPLTPTQGCLCTKEIWSDIDGRRTESNQQKLVDAVKKAGGADGYVIVIEIDDQQKPVSIDDILPYLKMNNK